MSSNVLTISNLIIINYSCAQLSIIQKIAQSFHNWRISLLNVWHKFRRIIWDDCNDDFTSQLFLLQLSISIMWTPIKTIWLVLWKERPGECDGIHWNNCDGIKKTISYLDSIKSSAHTLNRHDLLFTSGGVKQLWSLTWSTHQFIISIIDEIETLLALLLLCGPLLIVEHLLYIK